MLRLKTAVPGPKSLELMEKRKKFVPAGIANNCPVFVREARGAVITDVDGNQFVDFASGIGVVNVGHCPDDILAAVKDQLNQFIHTCIHVTPYSLYTEVAEKLTALTPGSFPKKTMFANSGAEAVENSVKISRRYTGKPGVISLECGFHGRTLMAMSLTSKVRPYKYRFGPFAPEVYKIPSAYCYRCYFGLDYPSCDMRCVKNLERFFTAECPPDNVAALLFEPVQGEGGFVVPPPEYLPGLREICSKYGIIMIADEIQSGFCRTGKTFACQHFGMEPDIMVMAKSLAAGFPLSAVTGRSEIMDACEAGEIGGTYGGNPVALAAANAVIQKIGMENAAGQAIEIGHYVYSKSRELQEKYPAIGDVRGLGAMVALELVTDRISKTPDKDLTRKVQAECLKRGLVVITAGVFGNVIRFLPPLVIDRGEMSFAMEVLDQAFNTALTGN